MSKFYEIFAHEKEDAWTCTPAPYVVIDGVFSIAELEAIVTEMKQALPDPVNLSSK